MNRQAFFKHVRIALFDGRLKQSQVDGLNFILDQWNETGFTDVRWLAYALATAFHETAFRLQPISEYGRGRGNKYGQRDPQTDQVYYGRGYVQLTWKSNYETAGRALGIDLVRNPDLALEPANAAFILFQGMADGWFTGKGFQHYLNDQQCDYRNARRIINGTDRAGDIANYALRFEAALDAAGGHLPKSRSTPSPETRHHWLVRLVLAVWETFKP